MPEVSGVLTHPDGTPRAGSTCTPTARRTGDAPTPTPTPPAGGGYSSPAGEWTVREPGRNIPVLVHGDRIDLNPDTGDTGTGPGVVERATGGAARLAARRANLEHAGEGP